MPPHNFTFEELCRFRNVPRETFDRLQTYVELLCKWQKTINLVGNATLKDVWNRHIIDSLQLLSHISDQDKIIDIGSGAGLPGLIIAIVRGGVGEIALLESDGRKVAFLKEAARVTKTDVIILHQRAEKTNLDDFTLIIARGFAPLVVLLNTFSNAFKPYHKLLLLKGKSYASEIAAAGETWAFDHAVFPSATDRNGVILLIQNIKKSEAK